jgi:hypothetical protein
VLNKLIEKEFEVPNAIKASGNYHFYFNHHTIDSLQKNLEDIISFSIKELEKDTAVYMAFSTRNFLNTPMPSEMKERFLNGMNPKYSGDMVVVLKSGYFFGARSGTTHGSWYPNDAHIPMVFMGWGVKHGKTNKKTYMSDIAPTLSALLHIQPPSGSIGQAVVEITD